MALVQEEGPVDPFLLLSVLGGLVVRFFGDLLIGRRYVRSPPFVRGVPGRGGVQGSVEGGGLHVFIIYLNGSFVVGFGQDLRRRDGIFNAVLKGKSIRDDGSVGQAGPSDAPKWYNFGVSGDRDVKGDLLPVV